MNPSNERSDNFVYIRIDENISYFGFADDFGPMSLGSIFEFCELLDSCGREHPNDPIAVVSLPDAKSLTNATFLIGSYLILRHNLSIEEVWGKVGPCISMTVPYRDVSQGLQNFDLHVRDCWEGLIMAKNLEWVDFGPDGFDIEEYQHFDSPLNADLNEVVPGKLIAMRGPTSIASGALWEDVMQGDGEFGHRDFSPQHYIDILHQFNVQAVVRLNEAWYPKQDFIDGGIAVADLHFDDCTSPPVHVAAKFLAIAEALPGAVAVHCKAGLGRTGTLVALYMMKHHGFSARAAMGWLRIVRPGSVIGAQQQFLCDSEAAIRAAGEAYRLRGGAAVRLPAGATLAELDAFIASASSAADARAAAVLWRSEGAAVGGEAGGGADGREELAGHVAWAAAWRSGRRCVSAGNVIVP